MLKIVAFAFFFPFWAGDGLRVLKAGSPKRGDAFCALTVLLDHPLVVEDATLDPRFARLPPVAGPPFVRF